MNENEERRVFNVALTRTKNAVYLLTEKQNYSSYINELTNLKDVEIKYQNNKQEDELLIKNCPICNFKLKRSDFSLYCPSYQYCGMLIRDKDIKKDGNEICCNCKWFMVLRNGKYGGFYQCLNDRCRVKFNVPANNTKINLLNEK